MASAYDMILVPPPDGENGASILLCASSGEVSLDPALCVEQPDLPARWKARRWNGQGAAPLCVKKWGDALTLRILETRTYEWALVGGSQNAIVRSSLHDADKQRWSVRRRPGVPAEGTFTVVNHLGHARLEVVDGESKAARILLEVCSTKLDHDREYRAMTEDIAEFCAALLMRWQAPTGLRFASNPAQHARTVLEKFFFLRHFFDEGRAEALIGMVERNPHRKLRSEREWKPAALAASPSFLSDPARFAGGWRRETNGGILPDRVMDLRKEESVDTEPNRFLLHVIGSFRRLCADVVAACGEESTAGLEAAVLRDSLAGLEAGLFFREVGRMSRLPLDNQTLQKRAGYRDFLRAWLLCEAASTVDWAGLEDSHHGDSRDVAKLYEYWVFIKLNHILEHLPGMTAEAEGSAPLDFIGNADDGCLEIRLKSGRHSRRCFRYKNGGAEMIVELHYEREFKGRAGALEAGSYSRIFSPDYTLAIRPAAYADEAAALSAGKVAFLHFDAKYRVEKTSEILGAENMGGDELRREKSEEKTARTYNRADLLKMHTYNDALRMTIGSYVLYPGDDQKTLKRFHEVAPGVGAYAMKPGNENCLDALADFIRDILDHQADRFTQYRYLADHQHHTVSNMPIILKEDDVEYKVAKPASTCVLVWMDAARERMFRDKGFAYCHAVPENGSRVLEVEISVEVGAELVPYGGGRSAPLKTKDWRAKIKSAKFLTKERLHDFLEGKVPDGWKMPASASHYLLFEFAEVAPFMSIEVGNIASTKQQGSRYMAFTCGWNELLAARRDI
jgi:predicted component of viral defense system (DUF524 family)